jgi:streptogramin lyase
MAAIDLTLEVPDEITCSATPGNAQEVTFPKNARKFRVRFQSVDGSFYPTGTDAAAIHADAIPISAGQWYEYPVPGAGARSRNLLSATRKGFFASDTASAKFDIVALP